MADAMEAKIEYNESKMTYENYLIWLRSYALKKRAMASKISTILARARSQPEKPLMPRP